jgi:hypothetical protein
MRNKEEWLQVNHALDNLSWQSSELDLGGKKNMKTSEKSSETNFGRWRTE